MSVYRNESAPATPSLPVSEPIGLDIPTEQPHSQADLDWWAQVSNENATDYDVIEPAPSDAEIDQAAGCAQAQARLDAGYSGWF